MSDLHPIFVPARIRVKGYKSLRDSEVYIRPLTILAGANSSGKSSIMQPLLLVKQTEESSYRTEGTLVLNGPNVKLSDASQVVPRGSTNPGSDFWLEVESEYGSSSDLCYTFTSNNQIKLSKARVANHPGALKRNISPSSPIEIEDQRFISNRDGVEARFALRSASVMLEEVFNNAQQMQSVGKIIYGAAVEMIASNIRHLPGLRGLPERSYPVTAESGPFRGTFEPYTASIIAGWQDDEPEKVTEFSRALRRLHLTRSVKVRVRGATEVELLVGRLPANGRGKDDLVNIADVGFGVSQALPVVVALLEAPRGVMVYIEQPELHLHPRAQRALAGLLADAANRGVRVVIETHSSILLLALQTLVAQGTLAPDKVGLHWFSRTQSGNTKVDFRELDENGAFGDWPEDFSETELEAQGAYLDAVEKRTAGAKA